MKYKLICFISVLLLLSGCKTIVTQKDVVLLPEDRIYTVPAGQKIAVTLDKKDLGEMVFPYDMKLVHESILERNEQQLNDLAFKKAKADEDKQRMTGIWGSILAIVSAIFGILLKRKGKTSTDKK